MTDRDLLEYYDRAFDARARSLSEYTHEERALLTQRECIQSWSLAPGEISLVPRQWRTEEMILTILRNHRVQAFDIMRNMRDIEFTKTICNTIAERYPDSSFLAYIPDRFKTNEMCLSAVVASGGHELEHVPEHLQTEEICNAAIMDYPNAIGFVFCQTKGLCMLAFRNSLHNMEGASGYGAINVYEYFDDTMLTPTLFAELIDVDPDVIRELDSADLWKVLPKLLCMARKICTLNATHGLLRNDKVLNRIKCGRLRRHIVRTLTAEKLSMLCELQLSTLSVTEIVVAYTTTDTFGDVLGLDIGRHRIERKRRTTEGKSFGNPPQPILSWADCWALAHAVNGLYSC
ncbi:MAG: hypothetical protein WC052_05595 [Patescibacteria group bacterium]